MVAEPEEVLVLGAACSPGIRQGPGCVTVSCGHTWAEWEGDLVGGLLGACCAGLTGGERKTQHEEAGDTASGCQRVEGVAKRPLGSREPRGPSEEPVESTTTSHV